MKPVWPIGWRVGLVAPGRVCHSLRFTSTVLVLMYWFVVWRWWASRSTWLIVGVYTAMGAPGFRLGAIVGSASSGLGRSSSAWS